jgi:hypothetical protein
MRSAGSAPFLGTSLIKIIRLPQVGQLELLALWRSIRLYRLRLPLPAPAVGYLSGEDFAARLDRAIARSDRAELIGVETNLDQLTARLLAQVTQPNQKYD